MIDIDAFSCPMLLRENMDINGPKTDFPPPILSLLGRVGSVHLFCLPTAGKIRAVEKSAAGENSIDTGRYFSVHSFLSGSPTVALVFLHCPFERN